MPNEFIKEYIDARGGVDSLSIEEKETLTEMASGLDTAIALAKAVVDYLKSAKKHMPEQRRVTGDLGMALKAIPKIQRLATGEMKALSAIEPKSGGFGH